MHRKQLLLVSALMTAVLVSGSSVYADEVKDKGQCHPHGSCHDDRRAALWHLLPDDKRKLLHDTMEKIDKENASLREQAKKLSKEIDDDLKSAPFNKEDFLNKEAQFDELRIKMKKHAEQEFAAAASQFTLEERRILAQIRHRGYHHSEHRHEQKEQDTTQNG